MKRLLLAAMLAGTPALAEDPWEGVWAADPDWCAFADRIGSQTPAPIRITAEAIEGYENRCAVTGVREGPKDADWWSLSLRCTAEGTTLEETTLLMLAGEDSLWRFFGTGDPIEFHRCGGSE